jgi:hypothetical protein
MTVMFDNNMAPRLARAIHILVEPEGDRVVALRDVFPQNTSDVTWISKVSQRPDWAVFTYDNAIRKRPHELAALTRTDLKICFLAPAWQKLDPLEQAYRLIKHWRNVMQTIESSSPGTSFFVHVGGKITRHFRS